MQIDSRSRTSAIGVGVECTAVVMPIHGRRDGYQRAPPIGNQHFLMVIDDEKWLVELTGWASDTKMAYHAFLAHDRFITSSLR